MPRSSHGNGRPVRAMVMVDQTKPGNLTLVRDRLLEGDILVEHVLCKDVRSRFRDAKHLRNHCDVVVFPGGFGPDFATQLGRDGMSIVKDFVRIGGGFLGICAGAYLGARTWPHFELSLIGEHDVEWQRGSGDCRLLPGSGAATDFPDMPSQIDCYYNQGPIFKATRSVNVLLTFASRNIPTHAFGRPAAISGTHELGRVVLVSPHMESYTKYGGVICNFVKWCAGSRALARPEPPMRHAVDQYIITVKTWLTDKLNYERHTRAEPLHVGQVVDVLEVQRCHETNRIRGRTRTGFFSIRGVGPDGSLVWAKKT